MPGFDRTGPWGEGPRTGRGMGRCKPGSETSEEEKDKKTSREDDSYEQDFPRGPGRGFGRGPGRGFGRGPGRGMGRGGYRWRGGSRW